MTKENTLINEISFCMSTLNPESKQPQNDNFNNEFCAASTIQHLEFLVKRASDYRIGDHPLVQRAKKLIDEEKVSTETFLAKNSYLQTRVNHPKMP